MTMRKCTNEMKITVDPKDWLVQNLDILVALTRKLGFDAEWQCNDLVVSGIPADRLYEMVRVLKRFNKDRGFWTLSLNGGEFDLIW